LRNLLNKIIEKNENLTKENENLTLNLNSLLKLLKDKDSKLKLINKNNELLQKYSNFNLLRIKILRILKFLIVTKKDNQNILLRFRFFSWKNLIFNRFQNLNFYCENDFTIKNSKEKKIIAFEKCKLRISTEDNFDELNGNFSILLLSDMKKGRLKDSFTNTDISTLNGFVNNLNYFIFLFLRIILNTLSKNKIYFMIKLKYYSEDIKKEKDILKRLDENRKNKNLFLEIVNNQEQIEINFYNKNIIEKNNDNLLELNKNEYQIQISNRQQINGSDNFVNQEHLEITHKNFFFDIQLQTAFKKIIFLLQLQFRKFENNYKYYFWLKLSQIANITKSEDKILLLNYDIKLEKLCMLVKRKHLFYLKQNFKKFMRKTYILQRNEEKEELEFFQTMNYSLILLGLLERIFHKNFNETVMIHRFFTNFKIKYLQLNISEMNNKLSNSIDFNRINENSSKKFNLLFRLVSLRIHHINNEITVKIIFYKWKIFNLKLITMDQQSILNSLPNLEDEFTYKINEIDMKYQNILDKNKSEYEKKLNEKYNENRDKQIELNKLNQKFFELEFTLENEKNNNITNFEK